MYIVRDKASKKIIHENPAPLTQKLKPKEIYAEFDAEKMEIGKTDNFTIPEHFTIDRNSEIIELTFEEKVRDGIVKLKPFEKIEGNQIVAKTVSERVAEGLLVLAPTQKIVEKEGNEEIVDKVIQEQIDEGLITLGDHEKIVDGEVVDKSLKEQIDEGVIEIDEPFEYLSGTEIETRSVEDLIKKKLLKTKKQVLKATHLLDSRIESEVASKYHHRHEIELIKGYMEWIADKMPRNDERERAYKKMQDSIKKVEIKYDPLKKQLSEIRTHG